MSEGTEKVEGGSMEISRDKMIETGLADKILQVISGANGSNEVIDFGVDELDFSIERREVDGQMRTEVVVEMPNTNPLNREVQQRVKTYLAFNERDKKLGVLPLSKDQYMLIVESAQ